MTGEKDLSFLKKALSIPQTRWILLDGCSNGATGALAEFLGKALSTPPEWVLIDEASSPDARFGLERSGSEWVVVDALHEFDSSTIIRLFKQFLGRVRSKRFLLVTNGALREHELPEYLGTGQAFRLSDFKAGSRDDAALLRFARKLTPRYALEDLVLGTKTQMKFTEALDYIRTKERCEGEWGFKKRHSRGHGVTLVFHGESGTGKTMAAEVAAKTLGLPLYQVDLSSIVSKWVGETERNLKAIFRAAEGVKGILLFDEGDALFGQRTKVEGSQDKYSNLEINFLLQEIEAFDGVAILSTNHEKNMDPAFLRRFTYSMVFGRPDELQRRAVWEANVPEELPLDATVDFTRLARFALTGGNIKNCIRDGAARAAALGKKSVGHEEMLWGIKREMQKHGLELDRALVGEDYWRRVAPEWEGVRVVPKSVAKSRDGAPDVVHRNLVK